MHSLLKIAAVLWLIPSAALPQGDSFTTKFKAYKEIAKGVDFFASTREHIAPFEKPVREAHHRLEEFLGSGLTPGAVVICSTLEQRDSVNEQKVLRLGYKWVVIQLTPEASNEEMLARIKAQTGGQVPGGILERMQNQTPEMKAAGISRVVSSTVQRIGYAILTTTFAPDKPFRSSRLDDVARSPMADWLDVGIVAYSVGGAAPNLRLLQDRMEEAFPIEDVIVMSRPFVVPGTEGAGGGGNVIVMRSGSPGGQAGPGAGQGAAGAAPGAQAGAVVMMGGAGPGPGAAAGPGGAGGRVGRGGPMPKDVQDRMMFDAQAASLFSYVIAKAGTEKARSLVKASQEKKDLREILTSPDFLGTDMEKLETEWQTWVKAQKADPGMRIFAAPANRPPGTPNN